MKIAIGVKENSRIQTICKISKRPDKFVRAGI